MQEKRGRPGSRYDIGQPGDLGSADDKVIACSVVTDNAALVKTCMEDIENGTFGNKTVYGDLSNGCLSVGTFSSVVPEDIQKQYLEVVDQIKLEPSLTKRCPLVSFLHLPLIRT